MFSFFTKNSLAYEKLDYDFSFKNIEEGLIDLNDYKAHNDVLLEAENLEAWELQTVIGHKKNRFL